MTINSKIIVPLILLLSFILLFSPFCFGELFFPSVIYRPLSFIIILTIFSFIFKNKLILKIPTRWFVIWSFQFFWLISWIVIHTDIYYLREILRIFFVIISVLFIYRYIGIHKASTFIINLLIILGILGIIGFILSYVGILSPIRTSTQWDGRVIYNFLFTSSVQGAVFNLGTQNIIRVCGFFDEPGTFAFFLTFGLLLNRLQNKINLKKIEILLIISGIFTFSIAFYISVAVYFILFYFKSTFKSMIAIILVFTGMIMYIDKNKDESVICEYAYHLVIRRFLPSEQNDEKIMSGDNRSNEIKIAINVFKEYPILGAGYTYSAKNFEHFGANIFAPLAFHGIFGFIFLFLPIFYLLFVVLYSSYITNRLIYLKIFIIIFFNLIQRPFITGLLNYLVIILVIELIIYNANECSKRTSSINYYSHI